MVRGTLARVRRHFARRGEWWWVPAFYALAIVWIYRDLWHQGGAATGLGWDTIDTHGPDLDFFASELREGRFSLWNPYDKGGYPVFCDPVFDRYYPFNWPFAAWGAIAGSAWWLVQIKVLAHHVAAASCMHLFLRARGLSVRAALVGGLGLVASAPLLTHKASNILWPLAWVPLAWLAIDAALAQPSWRRGVGAAAAVALCATAGSPPGLFYAMLLVAPYAVWRLATTLRARDARTREAIVRLAVCVGVAAIVVGLVLAVTVLPTQELVALGSRDRFGYGAPGFATDGAHRFVEITRGVVVRGAGPFEFYLGAAVVLLAACALVVRPRFDRGAAIAMWTMAAVALVLAAGGNTPVLGWLVEHVPGFALLRVPGRYKLLAAWTLAAGAGYGVAALEAARLDAALRRRVYACAAAAVAVTIVLVAVWGAPATVKDRPAWWSIVATAVAAGLVGAGVRAPRAWAEAALGALALCALLDAPLFTIVMPGAPPAAEPRQTHDRDEEFVARMPGVRDRWRMYDEFVLGERAGARLRVRDFRGYPAIDPLSLHRYGDVLDFALQHDSAIVTDFNVRWALLRPHFRDPHATYLIRPVPAFVPRDGGLWEARHPAPLVAWYGAAIEVKGDVLAAVRAVEEPDGARRRAVLEPEDAARLPAGARERLLAAAPGEVDGELQSYEPDVVRVAVDAPREGLVVLNEIMFPGWRVEVDGAAATPLRANYLLRAVWVEPGRHVIEWRFEPARWRILVGGYLLALAIMLVAVAWPRGRMPPGARWIRERIARRSRRSNHR